jgi:hypothetical protein
MKHKGRLIYPGFLVILFILYSCSRPLDWPESPLYDFNESISDTTKLPDRESAINEIIGHYAHFDVVSYEDRTTRTIMRTFIISYGFTDFYLDSGKLMQSDRFVRAEQKLSRKNAESFFSDQSVQAIKPRIQEVELSRKDGKWHLFRPESPSLLGINGDPEKPLSNDPADPNLTDPDNDGHPGVTVQIKVGKYFSGEIYLIRREIFSNHMTLNNNGTISGNVTDRSEQFVVGASKKILNQESHNVQNPDIGMNPVLLVKINPEIDTPEELFLIRDAIFPEEPMFYKKKKN